ncbi:hypothetical protein P4O66_020088 [Electrophorus voltai]|uniref:Uncharacterized protein n=1 Tax=Electrophorus voltai TaxID=2609070 RepID=A0AAD9E4G4_9TELE|nr:hypothetical protein P4O66_020088 [Electrophorus voltai]
MDKGRTEQGGRGVITACVSLCLCRTTQPASACVAPGCQVGPSDDNPSPTSTAVLRAHLCLVPSRQEEKEEQRISGKLPTARGEEDEDEASRGRLRERDFIPDQAERAASDYDTIFPAGPPPHLVLLNMEQVRLRDPKLKEGADPWPGWRRDCGKPFPVARGGGGIERCRLVLPSWLSLPHHTRGGGGRGHIWVERGTTKLRGRIYHPTEASAPHSVRSILGTRASWGDVAECRECRKCRVEKEGKVETEKEKKPRTA